MQDLLEFGKVRNWKGALLFYVCYLIAIILLAMILGGLGALIFNIGFETSVRLGNIFAVLVCLLLGYLILDQKGHLKNLGYWLLVLLSGVLALFGGGLLGLIPLSFLTTREKQQSHTPRESSAEKISEELESFKDQN